MTSKRSNLPSGPAGPAVAWALARAAMTGLRRRYQTISPTDLEAMTRSDQPPTIVDVRRAEDFEAGHIDGALNLPFDDFDDHRDEVPRGAPVVAVCYLGMLSRTAAQHLVGDGHDVVFNLDRGMKGWREFVAGRATEHRDGT